MKASEHHAYVSTAMAHNFNVFINYNILKFKSISYVQNLFPISSQ